VADQAGWSQHITVAAQRVLANNVLPIVIADRLADRPQTRVLLHSETQESVRRLVRSNAVDLAFLFSRDRPAHEPAELVGHLNLAFVASPSHALAGRATIEAADLAHHGFVGGLPESEFFQLIADVMADIRLANCRFVLNVQDSNAVKVAVSKNVGLALTFAAIIQEELARGELVELPVRSDRLRLPVFCVSRPNNPNVSLQRELLQGVRHHLSKLASDSERRVHHGET
jgi:DNA-binding transcriptional LysR family regulator